MAMYLTAENLASLRDVVENQLGDTLYTGYSGRGMYGTTCIGIVATAIDHAMFNLGLRLGQADPELAESLADERIELDSLGLSTIAYWPNVRAGTTVNA